MTDQEFQQFIETSMSELQEKQARLQSEYQLGDWPRWWLEQEKETIQFFDKHNNVAVEAETIDIGSFATTSNTWKWAWSNSSVLPKLRSKSESLKQLKDFTGIQLFASDNAFAADEYMAWELAAMSVKHLRAEGVYRAPSDDGPQVFLALLNIRKLTYLQ